MTRARVTLAALLLTIVGSILSETPSGGSTASPLVNTKRKEWLMRLPGDDNAFSNYDYRSSAFGDVDWPVEFVFRGNASTSRVKQGLCEATRGAWKYCDSGGPMYLFTDGATRDGRLKGFVADTGVKRFSENCATKSFTAHMRIYAPSSVNDRGSSRNSFYSVKYGYVVVATAHLDFEDHAGCSGRIHGYPDVAEAWFNEAMRTIPGWKIRSDAWNLGNGSVPYVVMRSLGGVEVPHFYGHDGYATDVVIK